MRIGIISSSDGYTVSELVRGLAVHDVSFEVLTDRKCGIEQRCRTLGLPCRRITEPDRVRFSQRAAEHMHASGVAFVLLFFNRIVSAELFATLPTFNIHPSLLPAFQGFAAVERAHEQRVRFIGATLHLATEATDAGPIVAQTCAPVDPDWPLEHYQTLSFIQRLYLALLLAELHLDDALEVSPATGSIERLAPRPITDRCNPALSDDELVRFVSQVQLARKVEAVPG